MAEIIPFPQSAQAKAMLAARKARGLNFLNQTPIQHLPELKSHVQHYNPARTYRTSRK
jgi:hypothetical protein